MITRLRRQIDRSPSIGVCLAAGLCVFLLSGCGKKKSDDTSFGILPESPIVITADTKDNSGNPIKAPWFSFRVTASNNTDTLFTILALSLKVTGIDATGGIKTTDVSFVPSDIIVNLIMGTETHTCAYTYFGEFASGQSKEFELKGDDTTFQSGQTCSGRHPLFYVSDNPKGPTGTMFRYSVKAKPLGWFGPYSAPEDRFETQFSFRTQ